MGRLAVLAVLLLSLPGPARAQDEEEEEGPWARTGAYLGVAGSYASDDFENPRHSRIANAYGLNARAGYRFHPHLAGELEGEWLDRFDLADTRRIGGGVLTANLRAYPLRRPAQPYLLVGIGGMVLETEGGALGDSRAGGFVARLGGGFDFYLSPALVANFSATYLVPTGAIDDRQMVSVQFGLLYRLGAPAF